MKHAQSFSGLMRERLNLYENRLAVGVRHWVIVEELELEGYKITVPHFRNELLRARKNAKLVNAKNSLDKILEVSPKFQAKDEPNPKQNTSLNYPSEAKKDDLV